MSYTEYGYRGLEEMKKLSNEIELLKKQIAEETEEKYGLMKRITELNEEVNELKKKVKHYHNY
tara:strand:+ start:1145 stop:1333 length:189 start_codon:yes stop_codon:yes gene_type:complete